MPPRTVKPLVVVRRVWGKRRQVDAVARIETEGRQLAGNPLGRMPLTPIPHTLRHTMYSARP